MANLSGNVSPLEFAAYVYGSLPPVEDASCVMPGNWPVYVRHLVDEFGPQVVWDVGLSALGFPVTWVRGAKEAEPVESAIRELQLQGKVQSNADQC